MERHGVPRLAGSAEAAPSVASFHAEPPLVGGGRLVLSESAAHHARVKRLEPGNLVRLTDGRGHAAFGQIEEITRDRASVVLPMEILSTVPPPPIHLCVPVGDRDRMLWLGEKAVELGVSSWRPVRFRRSSSVSPRGEGEAFTRKLEARMIGALEQSGGDWLPQLFPVTSVGELAAGDVGPAHRILLDRTGDPLIGVAGTDRRAPMLLFGPEGGIDDEERRLLVDGGWVCARLADTTLRFETAGIAAVSVIRAVQLSGDA